MNCARLRDSYRDCLIYALKKFMFRDAGSKLSNHEQVNCKSWNSRVVAYFKSRFNCCLPTLGPANHLRFLNLLEATGLPAGKVILTKLCGQLWYVCEELVAVAAEISTLEKKAMIDGYSHERRFSGEANHTGPLPDSEGKASFRILWQRTHGSCLKSFLVPSHSGKLIQIFTICKLRISSYSVLRYEQE